MTLSDDYLIKKHSISFYKTHPGCEKAFVFQKNCFLTGLCRHLFIFQGYVSHTKRIHYFFEQFTVQRWEKWHLFFYPALNIHQRIILWLVCRSCCKSMSVAPKVQIACAYANMAMATDCWIKGHRDPQRWLISACFQPCYHIFSLFLYNLTQLQEWKQPKVSSGFSPKSASACFCLSVVVFFLLFFRSESNLYSGLLLNSRCLYVNIRLMRCVRRI